MLTDVFLYAIMMKPLIQTREKTMTKKRQDKSVSTSMYSPRIIFDAGDTESSEILARAFDKHLAKQLAKESKNKG